MQGKGECQYSFFSLLIVKNINISISNNYRIHEKSVLVEVGQSRYKKALDSTLQKKDIMYQAQFSHNPLYCVDIIKTLNLISRHEWPLF